MRGFVSPARRAVRAIAALPMGVRIALVVAVVLHGCALSWGMPASDAWDNDGIAPRDILPGLAETFTPGQYYTYPPAQLILLTLLTLPVTLTAVVNAGTTNVEQVIKVILAPSYMTAFTMTARVVCLLMSLGVVLAIGCIAEEIAGGRESERARRVAGFAALLAAMSAPFTYYSHTSNLDVPYLFWGTLGALYFVRAIARREPSRLRRAAAFAALAIATKDQAYALFLFAAPASIAAWLWADPWARKNARQLLREAAIATVIAIAILAVVDGAITNPSGFRARLRFLSGPASQDYATYSKDLTGRIENFADIAKELGKHYPAATAVFFVIGLVSAVRRSKNAQLAAALVPLAIAISFTLGFNMVARRVEERFTLPHALFGAVYAGFGLELAWSAFGRASTDARTRIGRLLGRAACALVLGFAAREAARIDVTMLYEPRYDVEAFLEKNAANATIEIHGLNVYLPRFPKTARVWRVGHGPVDKRSPLPGVEEIQAPLSDVHERDPDFIVVSGCYVWRYLPRDIGARTGRIYPTTQHRDAADADATAFFKTLFEWQLGYHHVQWAHIEKTWFDPAEIHGSLNCPISVFQRNAP
jgi:hypothetical protein